MQLGKCRAIFPKKKDFPSTAICEKKKNEEMTTLSTANQAYDQCCLKEKLSRNNGDCCLLIAVAVLTERLLWSGGQGGNLLQYCIVSPTQSWSGKHKTPPLLAIDKLRSHETSAHLNQLHYATVLYIALHSILIGNVMTKKRFIFPGKKHAICHISYSDKVLCENRNVDQWQMATHCFCHLAIVDYITEVAERHKLTPYVGGSQVTF